MACGHFFLAALLVLGAGTAFAESVDPGIGPDAQGRLPPAVQPPWPERIPDYAQLDPATGLHMTGEPQLIRIADYVLRVDGEVERPLELGYDDIRRLPRVASRPTLVCEGFFVDVASWAGASLAALLSLAGPKEGVRSITLVSADGYEMEIDLDLAAAPEAFLAYELEGRALPVLHGFPLRAVFPGQNGFKWVKWIVGIRVGATPETRPGLDGAKEK